MDLLLFSVGGISHPCTMKLLGRVLDTELIVMVDSDASHCFVSESLVHRLSLPVYHTKPFSVHLGDGRYLQFFGMCLSLTINLGSLTISPYCYVFPLDGVDIILSISWLETLGDVKMN